MTQLTPEQSEQIESVVDLAYYIARKQFKERPLDHEDLAQAGLAYLSHYIGSYPGDKGHRFSEWAAKVMQRGMLKENVAMSWRGQSKDCDREIVSMPSAEEGEIHSLARSTEDDLTAVQVEQFLLTLRETDRRIAEWSMQDLTLEEIGSKLAMTRQAVHSRIQQIRVQLEDQGLA